MKALKIETNKSGKRYALVPKADGTFTVYAECRNYDGKVRGGIATAWRYCQKGLTLEGADQLFARKIAGGAR